MLDIQRNNFILEGSSVVVSVTSCEKTHDIHHQLMAHPHLLHIGVTDIACNRLEDTGVLIPLIPSGMAIIQLIADFK